MWLQKETEWVNWKINIIHIQFLNFEHNLDKENSHRTHSKIHIICKRSLYYTYASIYILILGWLQHKTTCKNIWRTKEKHRGKQGTWSRAWSCLAETVTGVIIIGKMITGVIMFEKKGHRCDREEEKEEDTWQWSQRLLMLVTRVLHHHYGREQCRDHF